VPGPRPSGWHSPRTASSSCGSGGGHVWIVENGVNAPSPFVDIAEEVGGWRDFGLLGFALHPDFLNNGYVYLYYVVDRHHLFHAGTGSYSPTTDEYFAATQGRITRYTAIKESPGDPDYSNATIVDYASRFVLHGDAVGTGCAILYESHGTGHLVFGSDNTLLAACGDGASYSTTDVGSVDHTYAVVALRKAPAPGPADGPRRAEQPVLRGGRSQQHEVEGMGTGPAQPLPHGAEAGHR
jgi:hypothetical protein